MCVSQQLRALAFEACVTNHTLGLEPRLSAQIQDKGEEIHIRRQNVEGSGGKVGGEACEHLLLDGVVYAEAIDVHLLLLPDAVSPIHGLQIHLRVPAHNCTTSCQSCSDIHNPTGGE